MQGRSSVFDEKVHLSVHVDLLTSLKSACCALSSISRAHNPLEMDHVEVKGTLLMILAEDIVPTGHGHVQPWISGHPCICTHFARASPGALPPGVLNGFDGSHGAPSIHHTANVRNISTAKVPSHSSSGNSSRSASRARVHSAEGLFCMKWSSTLSSLSLKSAMMSRSEIQPCTERPPSLASSL